MSKNVLHSYEPLKWETLQLTSLGHFLLYSVKTQDSGFMALKPNNCLLNDDNNWAVLLQFLYSQ